MAYTRKFPQFVQLLGHVKDRCPYINDSDETAVTTPAANNVDTPPALSTANIGTSDDMNKDLLMNHALAK